MKCNQKRKLATRPELCITPAGPMPKEKVHLVGPNKIVRRNEDGTYTIVPKPELCRESSKTSGK